jgi:hypothetical protein
MNFNVHDTYIAIQLRITFIISYNKQYEENCFTQSLETMPEDDVLIAANRYEENVQTKFYRKRSVDITSIQLRLITNISAPIW